MMQSRLGNRTALAVIAALTVVGCSTGVSTPHATTTPTQAGSPILTTPGTSVPSASAAVAPPSGRVVQWGDSTGIVNNPDYKTGVIDVFNATNPTMTLEDTIRTNMDAALRTALAAGSVTPDVVNMAGPTEGVELALAGQLLPLDKYVAQYGWDKILTPWSLALGTVNGHVYCIPNNMETLVVYYNKTQFDKNGWALPKTYADLIAVADQVKAAGSIAFMQGNAEYKLADQWFQGEWLNHVAGPENVAKALKGTIPWTDPTIAAAVTELKNVVNGGHFTGGLSKYYTTTFSAIAAAVASGKAAMSVDGTWDLAVFQDAFKKTGQELGWFAMPDSTGNPVLDISIGGCDGINKNSTNPDATAAWENWLLTDAGQVALAKAQNNPSPLATVNAGAMALYDPMRADILTALVQKTATPGQYGYTDWTFFSPKMETYWENHIEQVWAGALSVPDYLAATQAAYEQDKAANALMQLP